jgi:hypothetical protein
MLVLVGPVGLARDVRIDLDFDFHFEGGG